MGDPEYCDRCGRPLAGAGPWQGHQDCRAARLWEPPRYCGHCGRRTVVKVTPAGWSSRCGAHGMTVSPS